MSHSLKRVALVVALLSWLPFASGQNTSTSSPTKNQVREAMKSQLPAPPEGFSWQLYKNVVFLKPIGWTEQEMTENIAGIPATTYAASPEAFSRAKQFEMGVTFQHISGSQRIRGIPAKKLALVYLKPFLDAHKKEEVLMLEKSTQGDFERTFFRYRDAPPGLKPIIVHKFIVANDVTDNINIFTFESPVETWDENWVKYGTPIISKLNVMPSVPSEFNRFTEELSPLLEKDAATVMARGMAIESAKTLCARVGGDVAQSVVKEATAWRSRNDGYLKAAGQVFDEIGNRHISEGGEAEKQSYLRMVIVQSGKATSESVLRRFGGANLDNAIVPTPAQCLSEASSLQSGQREIRNTPDITKALVPYMEHKGLPGR
jgi:hypothetical protein